MLDCPYCGKTFGSPGTLEGHIQRSHQASGERQPAATAAAPRQISEHRFLRFIMKVCAFFVGAGLLGIAVAALLAIFGSHETFPSVFYTNPDGSLKQVGFGTYLWQVGIIVVVAGIIGALIWNYIGGPDPDDW
jgi:hypothetical protein